MVKWVTPLGRVFKIHYIFGMIFDRLVKIFYTKNRGARKIIGRGNIRMQKFIYFCRMQSTLNSVGSFYKKRI